MNGRRRIVPIWGYVVINLVVLLFLALLFAGAEWFAQSRNTTTAGIFPVLLVCYVCFFLVSVFDAIYDRFDVRRRHPVRPPPSHDAGKDGGRKPDSSQKG